MHGSCVLLPCMLQPCVWASLHAACDMQSEPDAACHTRQGVCPFLLTGALQQYASVPNGWQTQSEFACTATEFYEGERASAL